MQRKYKQNPNKSRKDLRITKRNKMQIQRKYKQNPNKSKTMTSKFQKRKVKHKNTKKCKQNPNKIQK